jgi:hypothetical protein
MACSLPRLCESQRFIIVNTPVLEMNAVCRLTLCSRSIFRFEWSAPFIACMKPIGSWMCSETQPTALTNESSLYNHTMCHIYTSLWMICSLPRHCETHRIIIVPTDPTISPCKWILSIGSHYNPDLYFASDCLFPSSLLWNRQDHFFALRPNHRHLQMNPVCRLTLCSRSILRFG